MKEIICNVGVVGSGKDFHAKRLKNYLNYYHINFADAIRNATWELINWKPTDNIEYERFKSFFYRSAIIN